MRIDDLNLTPPSAAAEKSQPAAPKPVDKAEGQVNGTDQAEVSNLAQALQTHDPQRIEQLRAAVQSGKYDVSAEALANAIIDAHISE